MVPARALRADARRNRERVLAAARDAFARDGLAVPIDDVARRAGVGIGTVYRHFPTKEALFEAVVLQRMEELVDAANARAGAEDAGAAFFDFLDLMTREGRAKRDLIEALAGTGVDVEAALSGIVDAMRTAVGRLLVNAQRAGAVRADIDVGELMAVIAGAFHALERGIGGARGDRVITVVYDGLRPPRRDVTGADRRGEGASATA